MLPTNSNSKSKSNREETISLYIPPMHVPKCKLKALKQITSTINQKLSKYLNTIKMFSTFEEYKKAT